MSSFSRHILFSFLEVALKALSTSRKKEKMSAQREKEGSLDGSHLLVLQGHWPYGQQVCRHENDHLLLLEEAVLKGRTDGPHRSFLWPLFPFNGQFLRKLFCGLSWSGHPGISSSSVDGAPQEHCCPSTERERRFLESMSKRGSCSPSRLALKSAS